MPDKFAVLDTNVFGRTANLSSPLWVSLKRLSSEAGIELCIPEPVLGESVNFRKEQYREAELAFLEANREIARFADIEAIYVPDHEAIAEQWESDLRADFRILASVADDALEALRRETERVPPARAGRGARDSLIWLTAKRLAESGAEVYFISQNVKDFAVRGGTMLLPELSAELDGLTGSLTYLKNLDAFFDLIADKVETKLNTDDPNVMAEMIGFELFDSAMDHIEWPESNDGMHAGRAVGIDIVDVRALREYGVEGRGLALVDGRGVVTTDPETDVPDLKFLAWVEFDLQTGDASSAELERVEFKD